MGGARWGSGDGSLLAMFGKLGKLFGRRGVLVPDADKLLEGEARKVDIGDPLAGGTQVILCRVEGRVHVLDSACPHEGGRIVPGPLGEGHTVLCPLHNYRFDVRTGKAVGVACRPARTYSAVEKDGSIEIFL